MDKWEKGINGKKRGGPAGFWVGDKKRKKKTSCPVKTGTREQPLGGQWLKTPANREGGQKDQLTEADNTNSKVACGSCRKPGPRFQETTFTQGKSDKIEPGGTGRRFNMGAWEKNFKNSTKRGWGHRYFYRHPNGERTPRSRRLSQDVRS